MIGLFSPNKAEHTSILLDLVKSALGSTYTIGYENKSDFTTHHTYEKIDSDFLYSSNFLKFGTKKFTNVLIWDIDTFEDLGYKPSLINMHNEFYNITGIEPSWTCETSQGYHIALVLNKGAYLTHQDNITPTIQSKAIVKLKRIITELIKADCNGSNRITGIWRNPLTHKNYTTAKKYTLNELLEITGIDLPVKKSRVKQGTLDIQNNISLKIKATSKIAKTLEKGYQEGNRNNYIFAYGYKIKFENREIHDNILLQMMQTENNKHGTGLTEKEVQNIHTSILKLSDTMFLPNSTKTKRGKLSNDMWKLDIHGTSNRRAYAGLTTSRERTKKTLKEIIATGVDLLDQGKSFDTKLISSIIEKHIKTVKRYEKGYNLKAMIFNLWHKKMLKLVSSTTLKQKIDIRPFVLKELYKEISEKIDGIFYSLVLKYCYLGFGTGYGDRNIA